MLVIDFAYITTWRCLWLSEIFQLIHLLSKNLFEFCQMDTEDDEMSDRGKCAYTISYIYISN